jgi:hypothetical protein
MPMKTGEPPVISFNLSVVVVNVWSMKGAMLLLFAVIILGIIAIFLFNIRSMRKLINTSVDKCEAHINIKNYTECL